MTWFAKKRMKIKRDNKYVFVNPGDEVPEAETWPNKEAWERQGYIRFLPREQKAIAEDKARPIPVEPVEPVEPVKPVEPVEPVEVDIKKVAKKPKKKTKNSFK